jgi:hypothetical protein
MLGLTDEEAGAALGVACVFPDMLGLPYRSANVTIGIAGVIPNVIGFSDLSAIVTINVAGIIKDMLGAFIRKHCLAGIALVVIIVIHVGYLHSALLTSGNIADAIVI